MIEAGNVDCHNDTDARTILLTRGVVTSKILCIGASDQGLNGVQRPLTFCDLANVKQMLATC